MCVQSGWKTRAGTDVCAAEGDPVETQASYSKLFRPGPYCPTHTHGFTGYPDQPCCFQLTQRFSSIHKRFLFLKDGSLKAVLILFLFRTMSQSGHSQSEFDFQGGGTDGFKLNQSQTTDHITKSPPGFR